MKKNILILFFITSPLSVLACDPMLPPAAYQACEDAKEKASAEEEPVSKSHPCGSFNRLKAIELSTKYRLIAVCAKLLLDNRCDDFKEMNCDIEHYK